MQDIPVFMENKAWYEYDFNLRKFVLTDKATEKAKVSYRKYYAERENAEKRGYIL